MPRALSAPGKLFLSGEYAVLWGGTARLAAVGPRVHSLVRRRQDREIHVAVEQGRLVGQVTPLGVRWRTGDEGVPEQFRFVARTIDESLRGLGGGREPLGFDLALSPSPVSPEGRKLGFGGSAMACVLTAEAAGFVLESPQDRLKLALLAHASAQNGKGSGADVATVFAGGLVRYRRYDVGPLLKASGEGSLAAALRASPPVAVWRLPESAIQLGYAFTRKSASTPLMVSQVESRLSAQDRLRFVERSDALGEELERGMERGDFAQVRDAVEGLERHLATLGEVETEEMTQIISLCRTAGAAAKLSGAGGGDGCVIFAPDATTLAQALEALQARGFHAFALTVEQGQRGEASVPFHLAQWLDAGG